MKLDAFKKYSNSHIASRLFCTNSFDDFDMKLFSFIKSIDARSTYSRQSLNKYGANFSLCRTRATTTKSMSSSGEQTIAFVVLEIIIIAVIVSLKTPYASSIGSISPLGIESNTLKKSVKSCGV